MPFLFLKQMGNRPLQHQQTPLPPSCAPYSRKPASCSGKQAYRSETDNTICYRSCQKNVALFERSFYNSLYHPPVFMNLFLKAVKYIFVLDETLTLLGRRAGYNFAAQRARNIYASESLQILRPTGKEELRAIDFFEKYSDQRLSFTDCVSFVLMQSKKIKRIFTFDHHFQLAGFQIFPKF